jgi:hypothetical protein
MAPISGVGPSSFGYTPQASANVSADPNLAYANYLNQNMVAPAYSTYQSSLQAAQNPPEAPKKKSGGILGFAKGIWNGAKNTLKSLATPKGFLMAAGGLLLTAVCPPAGLALAGMGVMSGGIKMATSLANGDTEGAGEGFFTAGASIVARRGLTRGGEVATATTRTLPNGLVLRPRNYTLAGPAGTGRIAQIRNYFNPRLTAPNGNTMTTGQIMRRDLGNFWTNIARPRIPARNNLQMPNWTALRGQVRPAFTATHQYIRNNPFQATAVAGTVSSFTGSSQNQADYGPAA